MTAGRGGREWGLGRETQPCTPSVAAANISSLPPLLTQAPGTRGASCMAWNEESSRLAVCVKRRLLFFALSTGAGLVSKGEAVLPEPAVTMMWAGEGEKGSRGRLGGGDVNG